MFRSWVAGESHDSDGVILSKGYKLWIRAKRFRSGPEKYFLGLFLGCQPIVAEENWTYNVEFELTLVNSTISKNKKLSTSHTFRCVIGRIFSHVFIVNSRKASASFFRPSDQ